MKQKLLVILLLFVSLYAFPQKNFSLKSPDAKIEIKIEVGQKITYTVIHQGDVMINPSTIALELEDGSYFGVDANVIKEKRTQINQVIASPFYKKDHIKDNCNELILSFKEGFDLVFRAYDEGAAYRFVSTRKRDFVVKDEIAEFHLGETSQAYVPYVKTNIASKTDPVFNSFENIYVHTPINQWQGDRLAFLPLLVEAVNNKKIVITEADLEDYPGMFIENQDKDTILKGHFARYPKRVEQGGHNMLQGVVKERENYMAKCDAKTLFPWRVISISSDDKQLLDSDLVYKLASPNRIGDVSWVKLGKVAWDWWNSWNLYGVDFKTGVNNATYKYYIDFASKQGIEYVILDEGWAVNLKADLFKVIPEIDLPELIAYAKERNVDLILWAGYHAFNKDIENICKHYAEMGIKGFKVDFMDRDDQPMVKFHYDAAKIAAKYKLLLNFHGSYKPTGLQRTYPNVINFEGVHGLETMKWSQDTIDQVTYDVTVPYIRMLAGPMDYTQGAMRNAIKKNYRPVFTEAMSQGTRCRQLAQYIIFEAPLTMLCDNPANYEREEECVEFITAIPTVWDETIALEGKVGEHVTIARRKDEVWYVGAMTNWDERSIELDLSFLGTDSYQAEIFKDGINADKVARDYKRQIIDVPTDRKLSVSLVSGGGCAVKIFKKKK
ncbi:glycoside hydrolase family 97 protein [Sphingobacterium chuzhouense]|uniref:Glycoside hydrolase family 97 protein n=1 Tax=Sphingobacterium chuzhouense TaxID=1742264 RepID=A0ABR7XRK1_9SPHI|nr:glycoside hydrolase family 97 protein [Sphingobacterium chuzhouense]MBD1421799.1 glycoside hydrolase family 97 protein [Sphingobacterium chuzhouense]